MTATQAGPTTAQRSSLFPWRRTRGARHPALKAAEDDRTLGERVADEIASFGGSWPFIFIFLGLIVGWMIINTLLIGRIAHGHAFDPYPYIALNLVLSGLAGIQAPIIMMSQNRQDTKDRLRGELDYDVNRRSAAEIQGLARKLNLLGEKIGDVEELLRDQLAKG